jgi:hypothetical protein
MYFYNTIILILLLGFEILSLLFEGIQIYSENINSEMLALYLLLLHARSHRLRFLLTAACWSIIGMAEAIFS